jgi:hypothetical protein
MSERADLRMFLHGAIILFIGYLCGFPLGFGMGDDPTADVHFWRVAHSGLVAGGVWSIATGAAVRRLSLGARGASTLAWSVAAANYGFLVNGFARVAAEEPGNVGQLLSLAVLGTFAVASAASLLAAAVTFAGAFLAPRANAPASRAA